MRALIYVLTHTCTHTRTGQALLALMSEMMRQVVVSTEGAALGAKEAIAASLGRLEGPPTAPSLPPYFDSYQVRRAVMCAGYQV